MSEFDRLTGSFGRSVRMTSLRTAISVAVRLRMLSARIGDPSEWTDPEQRLDVARDVREQEDVLMPRIREIFPDGVPIEDSLVGEVIVLSLDDDVDD